MKNITLLLIMLIFVGCMKEIRKSDFSPIINEEKTVGIGDVFLTSSEEKIMTDGITTHIQDGTFKFDLTIVELNEQKIGLQYSEYTKIQSQIPSQFGPIGGAISGWLIKEGFNKRFDYIVADKVVRFKV